MATKKKAVQTKKSQPKKSAPKISIPSPVQTMPVVPEVQKSGPSLKLKKSYVLVVLLILSLGALLYVGRSLFVAAVVNGQPISRLSVVNEAEKQSGKQALETMIRNTLIEQEAKKQNITVTEDEITAEIKKIEASLAKQGQKLDQALEVQGMTREDLHRIIRLDKMVTKLVGKDIKISDKEIDEYIEKNKAVLPENQSESELRKSVAENLKQQKMSEKVQSWLADLQKKANILYFVSY